MKRTVNFLILLSLLLTGCEKKPNTLVQTKGRKILLNNTPYLIKGICYHPVPKGEKKRSFSTLAQDLQLLQEAGINTIRVYKPVDDLAVLDQIHAAGIKLIMGFGYNQEGVFDFTCKCKCQHRRQISCCTSKLF